MSEGGSESGREGGSEGGRECVCVCVCVCEGVGIGAQRPILQRLVDVFVHWVRHPDRGPCFFRFSIHFLRNMVANRMQTAPTTRSGGTPSSSFVPHVGGFQ